MEAELELKVVEALAEDVGKGLVRLDPEDIKTLSAVLGDVIEISGEKKTVARITGTFAEHYGKKVIQMDGITRGNAKSNLGETVKIKRISRKTAMTVIVLPLDFSAVLPEQGEMDQFAKVLQGLAVMVGHGLIDNSLFLVDLMAIFMLSLGLLQRLTPDERN